MANKVLLKKSSIAAKIPQPEDLDYGELAINYQDGKLYYKKANNTIDSFSSATNNVVQATVASTSITSVDSWAIATYRSAKYLVQITQGSNYQVSEILVIHNGTTTSMTEFAVLETNGSLGTFTSDISAGNARLLVTMAAATSATISIERILMVV